MSCKGEGSCLIQCRCECYYCSECKLSAENCKCNSDCLCEDICNCNKYIDIEICTCGHREHNGYCKPLCSYNCEPKLCPNDKNHDEDKKGKLYPEWLFDCHGGNCCSCGILYGHGFINTNEIKECPVCYDDKPMTSLRCKHELCWDCWSTICNSKSRSDPETMASCPLCRRKKWGK
jgi:hypothetical protein